MPAQVAGWQQEFTSQTWKAQPTHFHGFHSQKSGTKYLAHGQSQHSRPATQELWRWGVTPRPACRHPLCLSATAPTRLDSTFQPIINAENRLARHTLRGERDLPLQHRQSGLRSVGRHEGSTYVATTWGYHPARSWLVLNVSGENAGRV